VPKSDPALRPDRSSGDLGPFVLYVEGPRDRSILRAWAARLMPEHAVALVRGAVILGGRRPARAIEHFRSGRAGSHALCVLDRDGDDTPSPEAESGLQFFIWGRRHIESYLLVPAAIRRALDLSAGDHRVEALLGGVLPPSDDGAAWRALDAKRLLGDNGPLARALGRPLPLARIARATREEELHADVHAVFARLREGLARSANPMLRLGGRGAVRRR
jgi:hypothetical protein